MTTVQTLLLEVGQAAKAVDWEKIIGPVVVFSAAWVLFERTERRKVRMAQSALRDALVAELHHVEVLLSTIVRKYCYRATDANEVAAFAAKIRWFVKVGKRRAMDVGLALHEPPEGAMTHFPTTGGCARTRGAPLRCSSASAPR